jgi:putative transcriptional regulator
MKEKLTIFTIKQKTPNKRFIDEQRIRDMSDEEAHVNALADAENPPLSKKELAQFKPIKPVKDIDVKAIRLKLGLSQAEFAQYFGVSVRTIQDWEQHRHKPSSTACNFLLVVAREPRAVQRALS